MDTIFYGASRQGRKMLIVFLPGFGSEAHDFEKKGFIAAVRERNPSIDMVAVDAHFGYYQDRSVVKRLWQDVMGPAKQAGYEKIWIVGTSLGGLGAIAFAREHADVVTGLVLLSPYLGPGDFIARIRASGGLAHWTSSADDDLYDRLWSWLKGYQEGTDRPEMILAFGERDALNPAHELLAEVLPQDRVVRRAGGHGWRVWKPLWKEVVKTRFDLHPLVQPPHD